MGLRKDRMALENHFTPLGGGVAIENYVLRQKRGVPLTKLESHVLLVAGFKRRRLPLS